MNACPENRHKLYGALAGLGLIEVFLSRFLGGRLHPDEIHQYLEPAHRLAFGYGTRTHEWYRGMRNLVAPWCLAKVYALAAALRCDTAEGLWWATRLPGVLASLATVGLLALRLGRRHALQGWLFVALIATQWAWLDLGARPMGENFSVAFIAYALYLAGRPLAPRVAAWAGFCLGAAVWFRYPAVIFACAVAAAVLGRAPWRVGAALVAGAALSAATLGYIDQRTWGHWFHSLIAYFEYNFIQDNARKVFGARPWYFYLAWWASLGPGCFALWLLRWRAYWVRPDLTLWVAGVYLAALSLTAHKEPRFFLSAVPLLSAGLASAVSGVSPRAWRAPLLLSCAVSALALGWYRRHDYQQRDLQRAMFALSRGPHIDAVFVLNRGHPGLSSLHRPARIEAPPSERLVEGVARFERVRAERAGQTPGGFGRIVALCDEGGDAPAGCHAFVRSRGFHETTRVGRVTLYEGVLQ